MGGECKERNWECARGETEGDGREVVYGRRKEGGRRKGKGRERGL